MASKKAIIMGINALKIAFPNYNPVVTETSNPTADLWLKLLEDVEDSTLEAAILVTLTEKRAFAPSIGEIRAAAMELHIQAAGVPLTAEAYDEVSRMPSDKTKRSTGQEKDGSWYILHTPLEWSHPLVEQTAIELGWPDRFPTDNPGVDRGQFAKAYEAKLARMTADGGRLPIVARYLEDRRSQTQRSTPAIMSSITKRLESK